MTRIDEALRQAGIKAHQPSTAEPPASLLDEFPNDPPFEDRSPALARGDATLLADFPVDQDVASQSAAPGVGPTPVAGAQLPVLERLIVHENLEPVAVEQYRQLAGELHQMQVDRGTKTLMVVSAQPAEGKTLTAVNLALTLSESYHRKVLLVDADLRRPSLGQLFQLTPVMGLSEALKAEDNRPPDVVRVTTWLSLLPGGGADPDPMAGLSSSRMERILQDATANFDWVILDTPPVALLPDTHLLAAMVDSAVLVIDAGTTPCASVKRAIDRIGRGKIAGVVLNRVEKASASDATYYEYYRTPPRRSALLSDVGGIAR